MSTLKAFRYRIYPTAEQDAFLRQTAGCCRAIYNAALEQRRTWGVRRRIRYEDQAGELKSCKAEFPWLKEVPSHCLQQALMDLDGAYRRFWRKEAGPPRPRSKRDGDRMRFPDPKQIVLNSKEGLLVLPKLGRRKSDCGALRVRLHRPIEGEIRSVTVTRIAGWWYASILCEINLDSPLPRGIDRIGADMGVAKPIALSDGGVISLPRVSARLTRRLRVLQQRLARSRKGSRNRRKIADRIAAVHAHLARRREDAAHKATTALADRCEIIAVEDLRVRNMTGSARGTVETPGRNVRAKAGLNRSVLDVSLRRVRTLLDYKTNWRNGTLVAVPAHYTSKTCAECGHVSAENRENQASFRCLSCGHEANADHNAARVILARGLRQIGVPLEETGGLPGMACGSSHVSDRKQEAA